MNIVVTTIISKNYLAFARVLAESLCRWCPDIPFLVLLADEEDGYFNPRQEPFQMLRMVDLSLPDHESFCFRHAARDLLSAVKPYLLEHLLDLGFRSAVYLDADILILDDLAPLLERVAQHALTLTPHVTSPLSGRHAVQQEVKFLRAGIYNGGFIGMTGHESTRRFLRWWQSRVAQECVNAPEDGLLWDQRWIDLAPSFVEDTGIVRDPAYNVAYWNLSQRKIHFDGDSVLVEDRRCGFFHFSGFDPRVPDRITAYWPADEFLAARSARMLFERYATLLRAAGSLESMHWPYAYGVFDNGVTIPELARKLFRAHADPTCFGNPFQTSGPDSFFAWLNSPIDNYPDPRTTLTRLWKAVYEQRPDLSAAFPDFLGADRDRFLTWITEFGGREYGIPPAFIARPTSASTPIHR